MSPAIAAPGLRISLARLQWLLLLGLAVAIYWAVLTFVYVHSVAPLVGTNSFLYLRINGWKVAESIVWGFIFLPTIDGPWKRPSQFGLTLLYMIGFVPTLVIYGLSDQPRDVMYTIIGGYAAVIAGVWFPVHMNRFRFRAGARAGIQISATATIFVFLWYLVKSHGTFNVDLEAVYQYRDQANSIFNFGPVTYIATWTFRVLVPYCACYFALTRKWMLVAVACVFQAFCLVIYQEKAVFIPIVMMVILYMLPPGRAAVIGLIAGFVASIVACDLIYELWDNPFFLELWPRRFFFVQQFLYFSYFHTFSKIGFVYYSDSFLGWLIHYPFPHPPSTMVEYYEMGLSVGNPNTGFFGAGYMELGKLGVILYGLGAGLVLRLFDRVTPKEIPMWFFGTVATLPFQAMLIEENFITSILTGGIAIAMFLMMCTRLDKEEGFGACGESSRELALNPRAPSSPSPAGTTA